MLDCDGVLCYSELEFEWELLKVGDFDIGVAPSLLKAKLVIFLWSDKLEIILVEEERVQKFLSHVYVREEKIENVDLDNFCEELILSIAASE